MATENYIGGMAQPTRPINIAGRTDIAKVTYTFHDGRTVAFPSIDSVTSASSIETTPSNFGSRSSSQPRGRRGHGGSFSSTSSVRDSFGLMSMPSISDDGATDPDSNKTAIAYSTTGGCCPPFSDLDHVDMGEEWGTQTLRPGDLWGNDTLSLAPTENQDHLVARADGAHLDLPQDFEDMDTTVDDISITRSLHEFDESLMNDANYGAFLGPQSAPPASDWMQHARRDRMTFPMPTTAEDTKAASGVVSTPSPSKAPRKPGRARGSKLPEDKRQKVALMRKVGACEYCKAGRRGCDPGTPCKPCIQHFGAEVLDKPNRCRTDIVGHFCGQILSTVCKWHPHPREMTDFFGRDFYVTDWCYNIPIKFVGFGPYLMCEVVVLQTSESSHLQHQHVLYHSPLANTPGLSNDYVLPVTFRDPSQLYTIIDRHLSTLVDEHFSQFSVFNTRFPILNKIWKLYCHYRLANHEHATLLHQALKLLILVHNTEITIPTEDASVAHILHHCAPGYLQPQRVTPCILRAELGKVMPQLAQILLEDVLKRLLRVCLDRRCDQHPPVLAGFAVLMMVIESVMYNSSRIGYHAHSSLPGLGSQPATMPGVNNSSNSPFDSITHPVEAAEALRKLENAAWDLQTIYCNCFENCHALLLRIIEDRHYSGLQKQFGHAPASFIAALNQAIRESGGYLESRVVEKVENLNDTTLLFDRLLARLFLLQTGPY